MKVNTNIIEMDDAKKHYDMLYKEGYMDEADATTKRVLKEIFSEITFPEKGVLLDFGCGQGAYIEILRELLPAWEIHGAEISDVAVSMCREQFPDVLFTTFDSLKNIQDTYDIVFSRHVLEHVQDIDSIFRLFSKICRKNAFMIHSLPSGNAGSFEHTICLMREDGIDISNGNRFFFEDSTHLRRLCTEEMNALAQKINFFPVYARYKNQFYGALKWISEYDSTFRAELFCTSKSRNFASTLFLIKYRILTELLSIPLRIERMSTTPAKSAKARIVKPILRICIAPINRIVVKTFLNTFTKNIESEWATGKENINGSEMFVVYERKEV